MSSFKIINGSCVDQEVDAIVNAANGNMIHAGGVAKAIHDKAGAGLDDACHKYNLPVRDGEVIVTPAFNIKNAKIIIHAVGPNFYYSPEAFGELCDAYYKSLEELKKYNYHSIAFPLISSGIFGGKLDNPVATSTKYCIKAYNNFITAYYDYDIDVKLCAFGDEEYEKAIAQQDKMDKESKEETKRGFDSIDEIINYLKNDYKKAEYYTPDPSYTIGKNGEKIIYMGGLKYDIRAFDIPKFLKENKYIDDSYYNEYYDEFSKENYRKYDYNTLDIKRVSYLIIAFYNGERISEGLVDDMIRDGYMLKLVERAKELKEEQ